MLYSFIVFLLTDRWIDCALLPYGVTISIYIYITPTIHQWGTSNLVPSIAAGTPLGGPLK